MDETETSFEFAGDVRCSTQQVGPDVRRAQEGAKRQPRGRRTTAENERAVDQALADSFPASDPPPWTLRVARGYSEPDAIALLCRSIADRFRDEDPPSRGVVNDGVILSGGSRSQRTMFQWLATLVGTTGIALLVPIAILLVGLPVVLVVRGVVEAIAWLMTFVLK